MRNIKLKIITNKEKQKVAIEKNNKMTNMNSMLRNEINKNRVKE